MNFACPDPNNIGNIPVRKHRDTVSLAGDASGPDLRGSHPVVWIKALPPNARCHTNVTILPSDHSDAGVVQARYSMCKVRNVNGNFQMHAILYRTALDDIGAVPAASADCLRSWPLPVHPKAFRCISPARNLEPER